MLGILGSTTEPPIYCLQLLRPRGSDFPELERAFFVQKLLSHVLHFVLQVDGFLAGVLISIDGMRLLHGRACL